MVPESTGHHRMRSSRGGAGAYNSPRTRICPRCPVPTGSNLGRGASACTSIPVATRPPAEAETPTRSASRRLFQWRIGRPQQHRHILVAVQGNGQVRPLLHGHSKAVLGRSPIYPGGRRSSDFAKGCWSWRPPAQTATHSAKRLPNLWQACRSWSSRGSRAVTAP